MPTVWKSRGRVSEVFAKFWEGGIKGLWKFLGEGTPFWCFIAFLLTSFAKILEGGFTFIPPLPPSPPCVHLWLGSKTDDKFWPDNFECHGKKLSLQLSVALNDSTKILAIWQNSKNEENIYFKLNAIPLP